MEEIYYGPTLAFSEETHANKYRPKGETFYDMCNRISATLGDGEEHRRSFRSQLLNMSFLPGGRIQLAVGAPRRVTAFNCFVSRTIEDSSEAIMDAAKEAFMTQRLGGGIGYDFSTIRPKGARIKSMGSAASGPVSFMHIFDAICSTVASAGARRGAQMGVLRVDHPDIEEFIAAKRTKGVLTNFNVSVGVTDDFMEAVLEEDTFDLVFDGEVHDTVDAKALWEDIMRSTWDYAEPGIIFLDRINKMNNLWYCETICATNPCLHPDSMVETTEGAVRIADMTTPMMVYCKDYDGNLTTSMATPSFISKKDANTLVIEIDSGKNLTCTPDHRLYVLDKGYVRADELVVGERVGHLCRTKKSEGYSRVKLNTQKVISYIPEHRFIVKEVLGSLTDADDVHHIDENTFNNKASNLEVLSHGKHSKVSNIGADKSSMERDTTGKFIKIPLKKKKTTLTMPDELKSNLVNQFSGKVVSICEGETTDVWDITVDKYHNFIANFIIVHNCGEQPLPPYGACLLGSFNMTKYLKRRGNVYMIDFASFERDIPDVVRAMDNVIDRTVYPLLLQEQDAKDKRRMGLGVTGIANALEACGHAYGSTGYLRLQDKVLKTLRDFAYEASALLAAEKGSFPLFDAEKYLQGDFIKTLPQRIRDLIAIHGMRNSHLLSIAPTGTISICADNVSSAIEPPFSHEYDRTVKQEGGFSTIERVTDYGMRELGVKGRTADEISVQDHVNVLIHAQKFVDSAVSKTCNVGDSVTYTEFKDVYMSAWKGGAKGATTFRSAGKREGILKVVEAASCTVDLQTGERSCE